MIRTQVLKYSQEQDRAREEGTKEMSGKGATARGAMEEGGCVRVIEREEVRGDDPNEYFLPTGVGSTF